MASTLLRHGEASRESSSSFSTSIGMAFVPWCWLALAGMVLSLGVSVATGTLDAQSDEAIRHLVELTGPQVMLPRAASQPSPLYQATYWLWVATRYYYIDTVVNNGAAFRIAKVLVSP